MGMQPAHVLSAQRPDSVPISVVFVCQGSTLVAILEFEDNSISARSATASHCSPRPTFEPCDIV
jgi:hypothetical protein